MISKELSVIFPIYNEQETIKETLLEWRNTLNKLQINYEIILAEDGSTDNTKDILIDLLINNRDLFVSNIEDKKRGYANAIRSSVKIAKGKYILNVDSDGQCDPKDFINFWKKRDHLENSIIIGHRYNRKDSLQRLLMSKFFLILHRVLFFSRVKDPSCPYILSKNEFFVTINPYLKFMVEGFWWGFVAICLKKNIQIYQVKINHRLRLSGQTNVFHLNKIPSIALRNIYGLIKLRFLKIN
jgi:glycosyltransferase involved in cell wall biosynthesis